MASIKKNFTYQALYQILSMILPLITSPILSRALGARGLGIYSYTNAIMTYFVLVANMGIYRYGIRCIAKVRDNKEERNRVFCEILTTHGILSALVIIAYIVFIALAEPAYRLYYSILIFSYLGGVLNLNWFFFGLEEYKSIAIRDMVIKIITFLFIIFLVKEKDDLVLYFIIMSISSLVSSLIYFVLIKDKVAFVRINYKEIKTHLKEMSVLFIPALLETLYVSIDKVMLGKMYDKAVVGYYENADKALIARTLVYSLINVTMPRMANLLMRKNSNEFDLLMKKTTELILYFSLAFAFGTAAISREFSIIFWGEDFSPCAALIVILAFSIPANTISREIRDQYLVPASKDKSYIYVTGAGALIDIVLNILMIPALGAVGAATATLITEYAVLIMQIFLVKRELDFTKYINFKDAIIYCLIGIVMFFEVKAIGCALGIRIFTLLLQIFIGALTFVFLSAIYWKKTKNIITQRIFGDLKERISRRAKR